MIFCNFYVPWYLQCERLMGGMQKIAEASVQLNELNDKLAVQKVAVTEKTGDKFMFYIVALNSYTIK